MSKIVLLTFGTYGDVAPYVGLGVRLRQAGHEVALASQQPYERLIRDNGLDYRFLPKDTERATRESPQAQALIDGDSMRPSKEMSKQLVADMEGVGPAMAAASEGAEALLCCGPVGALFGYHVAEALAVPSAALHLQPLARTGDFAPPVLTLRSFGRLGNRAVWKLGAAGEKIYLAQINELREQLGLGAVRLRDFQPRRDATWPMLFGYSAHVAPRPSDWGPQQHITGYWWPPTPAEFAPPAEVVEFLAAGPPPVFVGFGSTATRRGVELTRLIAEAAERADVRVIVQSGWAELGVLGRGLSVGLLPYEWLFPQVAAVVHHAGAGTTAAALRAGRPSVPVPGIMDQPYWSQRLVELGAAPGFRRRRELDAAWLAGAIEAAVTDPSYGERAGALAAALEAEDGAGTALALIEELLGRR